MKIRNKRKKNNMIKGCVRFKKEKLDHCCDCKHLFNSVCGKTGVRRYKNEIACYQFEVK